MAFPRKHLYNDEQIVLDRNPHWWYLAPRAFLLVLSSVLGILALVYLDDKNSSWQSGLKWIAGAAIVVTLVAFLVRLLGWRATDFVITTDRCIYRSGVLKKTGIEIPLERITVVYFSQTFLERLLGAGDLGIESAGEGSRQNFSDIRNPVDVQNTIYKQMEENENRKYDRIGSEARQAAVGAPPTQVLSVAEQLEKLAELQRQGVITPEQFAAQRAQLLGE